MDETVQTAMQPITVELRTLMENIQKGALPASQGNVTSAPNRDEQSGVVAGSSGMHGVSDPYQDLQASTVPSFLGPTMLGHPVGVG